ncbi:H-NS histone family protein [Xanthomonas fragariae]|uniref:H-NS histone family protein n=1 Tax=Xanthomonas fragariae TaxID=48664 RepID=UPI000D55C202|nr:H-NS family nucleoid-associated regulatory protein [Xanthomonas fragariae]MDM7554769.1 H-NS family nucleoid-associated regulatory protein [Xanthomonas fragariae]MDM7557894.1 H-NS family nucleoid-associated regulatory protein [Xanthomonas fragariae]MDM7575564.1 H-NS family nucleoid-associated regulatory protein [Xanthomonas fragariae]MDM7578646.1 H-NS family nucleoid-associated regulatory protein [Xanthomonas fragariae]MDM7588853.1 H-NS family nucleoid-associated regulatory protein [Xanthomo
MRQVTSASSAATKSQLLEELRKLEQEEAQLKYSQTLEAFDQVIEVLTQFGSRFNAKQKSQIASLAMTGKSRGKLSSTGEVVAKYWIPHSGETWSGRGRKPRAFKAWEGTSSYKEWKANHPDKPFPLYPG